MKFHLIVVSALAMLFSVPVASGATTLTFEDPGNLGVTLGGGMTWNGIGGGHLVMEEYTDDDFIFVSPSYVQSFQMNAQPLEGYGRPYVGLVDVAAFDSSNNQVWSATLDLTNYTQWDQWLTVNVNTDNVASITFYSPFNTHGIGFWPSIDNMVIGTPVPVPSAILLFGSSLIGFAFRGRRLS